MVLDADHVQGLQDKDVLVMLGLARSWNDKCYIMVNELIVGG